MKADSSANRNAMTKTLLDYGFSKINSKKLYDKDSIISTINIDKAKNKNIYLYAKDNINLIYEGKLDEDKIIKEIEIIENIIFPLLIIISMLATSTVSK